MAYTVPPVWGLERAFALVANCANVSCSWLNMGDSKTTDGSTGANLGYGMARTFNVPQWKFRVGRAVMGPEPWAVWGQSVTTWGTATVRDPGATFGGGQTLLCPVQCTEFNFTSDNVTAGSVIASAIMVDCFNYASGDPFTSLASFARQTWYRDTNQVASVRVSGGRNTNAADSAWTLGGYTDVTATTNGVAGWQYTDATCGSGTGRPIVAIRENSIAENTGGADRLIVGPRVFFRGTTGSPVTGFGLGDIALGALNALTLLRMIGGDGANRTTSVANCAWHWTNTYQNPNIVHLDIWQNISGSPDVSTELNAGTGTTMRAQMVALADQINLIADTAGAPRPIIIFCNSYRTGYSDLHYETRASVLYELAQAYGGAFIDYTQLMARSALSTSWWCGNEDVHPTGGNQAGASISTTGVVAGGSGRILGNGAEYWASTLWNAGMGAYHNSLIKRPRGR